jgi:hypothetical protein
MGQEIPGEAEKGRQTRGRIREFGTHRFGSLRSRGIDWPHGGRGLPQRGVMPATYTESIA